MIVVTGGAGFLGRALVARLLRHDKVVVLDDLSTSTEAAGAWLAEQDGCTFARVDVAEPRALAEAVKRCCTQTPREVYHLASPASPPDYARMPEKTLRTGSEGTRNMLAWARRWDARFLMASTSEVYGDPLVHPQPETYVGHVDPVGPRAVYDEAKRFAEAIVAAYHRSYGLDVRIARIFNTYGPGMRPADGRVISTFVHNALAGQPLPVHGDGTQTRSFCYVDDMVEGLQAIMAKADASPVNVGNPEEHTVLELAEAVWAATGSRTGLRFLPLPQGDPRQRRPDIGRARRLGWQPRIGLQEGLEKYVQAVRGIGQAAAYAPEVPA